jgi:hypothetical protein
VFLVLGFFVPIQSSLAAAWRYQPSFGTGAQYESNPSYHDDEREDDATALTFSGQLNMSAETRRTRWTFTPNAYLSYYSGSESKNIDEQNYHLPLTGLYRTRRGDMGFSSRYSQRSTRNAELEPAIPDDPDNPPPAGSGNTNNVDDDQSYWTVGPYLRLNLSPADAITMSGSYAEVSYDDAELTGQAGYENLTAGATYQHSFDARNSIFVSVDATYFTSEQPCRILTSDIDICGQVFVPEQLGTDVDNDTDTYGATLGYQYTISNTESIGVTAGAARSDFTVENLRSNQGLPCFDPDQPGFVPCRLEGSETNFIGDMSYTVRSEKTISTVSLGRSLQPSSDGATVTQDNFRAFWIREISPRLQISAGVTLLQTDLVGSTTRRGQIRQRFEREYWRVTTGASWRLTRHWSIRGTVDYIDNDHGDASDATTNGVIGISLRYTGNERRNLPW